MPKARTYTSPVPALTNRGGTGLLKKLPSNIEVVKSVFDYTKWPKDRIRCKGDVIGVDKLVLDPMNARLHPEKNLEAIKQSLCQFGQMTPLVVRKQNMTVMAGNGRLVAAMSLGWTRMACSVVEMTDGEAASYGVADNKTAESALWDFEVLRRLERLSAEAGYNMPGWTDEELVALRLGDFVPQVDEDDVPPAPVNPVTQLGDLWLLGEHRLLCGDSTKKEDVERLLAGKVPFIMITDPPYGVEYDPQWRHEAAAKGLIGFPAKRNGKVVNDGRRDWTEAWLLFPGDVVYCWHAGRYAGEVQRSLESAGFEIRSQIIWAKDSFSISRGAYHWQHEPCYFAVRKGATADWTGDRSQSTLWKINKRGADDLGGHGTQKPYDCHAKPMGNHGRENTIVYDPFLGTGTTIVAAQKLKRIAIGLEIDQVYCDVILQRWADYTGLDPIRESDGASFRQLRAELNEVV